ncbi:DNA topology modulation protein [Clostridium sp. D53t1_180928_C8]|uniref:DNA topology modulation protein n=1 Tax=Clostridium sp. D53t1_180928_C8 TaxID=2787101 RepID=UPI0018AB4F73|nr:DNA topology modulation protein [Clostridium sp. D53t1_180928_C8]
MKRIIVIGCGGAGKSTFSRKLSEKLNIPVYHLDKFFWNKGWVSTPKDKFNSKIEELVNKEEWIIDGNYIRTLEVRAKKSDTIIFINMPTYLCLYRIIKRRFMYKGKSRPDMAEGCPEGIDFEFFKWVFTYNKKIRPQILDKLNIYNDKNIIILNGKKEVKNFIENRL